MGDDGGRAACADKAAPAKDDDLARNKRDDDAGGDSRADDSSDKLGKLAKIQSCAPSATDTKKAGREPDEARRIDNAADKVIQSFIWYTNAANNKLETLRGHIKAADQPSLDEKIGLALLKGALEAGAQATGLRLAKHLASPVQQEFAQNLFGSGIVDAVEAGKAQLNGKDGADAVDPFIDAQKEGVATRQMRSQSAFIDTGRYKLETADQAEALARAFSEGKVAMAAEEQEKASRNSWVSYLAQQKYGSAVRDRGDGRSSGRGNHEGPAIEVGKISTNMGDEGRTSSNDKLLQPDGAPDPNQALFGNSPGILTVVAELPPIERVYQPAIGAEPPARGAFSMKGTPTVKAAVLNGVGEKVREAYQGKPLAQSHIPRQVVARINGGAGTLPGLAGGSEFTLSLDEQGNLAKRPEDLAWLAARAVVAKPARASFEDDENYTNGVEALLNELVPEHIRKQLVK